MRTQQARPEPKDPVLEELHEIYDVLDDEQREQLLLIARTFPLGRRRRAAA